MIEKYTLFTNLDWVTIGPVRTFTHALLLQDAEGLPRERQCKVRGFGTDSAWPTFDIFVESLEYELTDAQGNLFKLEDDGSTTAVITGAIMQIKDGPRLDLVTCDRKRPLDIEVFEGERRVQDVWAALQRKVPEYWDAPNMPTLTWLSAETVRRGGSGRVPGAFY